MLNIYMWFRNIGKQILFKGLLLCKGDANGEVLVTVRKGPARGIRLKLDFFHQRRESWYWLGKYDESILSMLGKLIQPGWMVWDCGIYLGYYTMFFARQVGPGGKVYAFEPDRNNLQRSRRHAALNDFEDRIQFVHAAIAGQANEVSFLLRKNNNSRILSIPTHMDEIRDAIRKGDGDCIETIKAVTLDQSCILYGRPQLVKLDIEGAEIEALQGAAAVGKLHRPYMVIESHNPATDKAIEQFALQYNFRLYSFLEQRLLADGEGCRGTMLLIPEEKDKCFLLDGQKPPRRDVCPNPKSSTAKALRTPRRNASLGENERNS